MNDPPAATPLKAPTVRKMGSALERNSRCRSGIAGHLDSGSRNSDTDSSTAAALRDDHDLPIAQRHERQLVREEVFHHRINPTRIRVAGLVVWSDAVRDEIQA